MGIIMLAIIYYNMARLDTALPFIWGSLRLVPIIVAIIYLASVYTSVYPSR